ncbi:hypothetical protein Tco_0500999 [Tanacetum coccineum]
MNAKLSVIHRDIKSATVIAAGPPPAPLSSSRTDLCSSLSPFEPKQGLNKRELSNAGIVVPKKAEASCSSPGSSRGPEAKGPNCKLMAVKIKLLDKLEELLAELDGLLLNEVRKILNLSYSARRVTASEDSQESNEAGIKITGKDATETQDFNESDKKSSWQRFFLLDVDVELGIFADNLVCRRGSSFPGVYPPPPYSYRLLKEDEVK